MKLTRRLLAAFLCSTILMGSAGDAYAGSWQFDGQVWKNVEPSGDAHVGWYSEGVDDWYYLTANGDMRTGWEGKYHLHEVSDGNLGRMDYGWYHDSAGWYFLNTEHNGSFGEFFTGWQWIDGYCYYFGDNGVMYADCNTPDGYQVDRSGRWVIGGSVQFVDGKGFQSKHEHKENIEDHGKNSVSDESGSEDGSSPGPDQKKDADRDGLDDSVEAFLGTDAKKSDSDRDGLSDYIEITDSYTDPAKADSEGDGISDGDRDLDGDGLTNLEEVRYGSSCGSADTDFDGIDDYDEIFIYHTDPVNPDTDGDGIRDGREIELGLNPLKQSTDSATKDSARKVKQDIDIPSALLDGNVAAPAITAELTAEEADAVELMESAEEALRDNTFGYGKPVTLKTGKPVTLSFDVGNADRLMMLKLTESGPEILEVAQNGSKVSIVADEGSYQLIDVVSFCDYLGIDMTQTDSVAEAFSLHNKANPARINSSNAVSYTQKELEELSGITNEDLIKMVIGAENNHLKSSNSAGAKETDSDAGRKTQDGAEKLPVATASNSQRGAEISTYNGRTGDSAYARIVFVIDDTGSMGPYIQNVKRISLNSTTFFTAKKA